ncbi:MAG TPA: amino acid adenylation domain-containing protein [Pseudonocardiaceae bacterium]
MMTDTIPLFDEAFDHNVLSTPDAVAIEYCGRRLSYRELAVRATRLACELAGRGVGPDSIVGVAASPSLELPVAILAILRAGGAWLPLDPGYPVDRLRHMLTDSGISLLVADPETAARIAPGPIDVIDPAADADRDFEPVPARALPDHLAYVIYTSGSTGRPKGVALTHGGLANLARAQVDVFGVRRGDRVLQFAPTSFDASVFELVMALYVGATLVLAPRDDIPPGPELADFLRDKHISHVTLPPSVLATLPDGQLPDLAVLVCAGEALPEHLVRRWLPGRRMFNAYGPTETTVWATVAELTAADGKPTIGVAVSGARAVVLDGRLRPVPAGTPGELAIGGRGVARGYLGQPALTAARFVPDPDEPGGRLYRTGDLVVRGADGNLEFLGRIDHQVKIRGIRIEPDEIAHQLTEHPLITDAVVIARDDGAGTELVGYVVGSADPTELGEYLAARLPAHLVPATIMLLADMPLTPSGKIDRAALPAPVRGARSDDDPPATPTERALARILADLLSVDRVGVHADFFALGGHSLLAGRLAARVRAELGRELPMRRLYAAPTVAEMAALLDTENTASTVPPIRPEPRDADATVPLSFPQERIWFLEKLAPGNLAYNAQATIRLRGPLDHAALRATLTEIVRRHEVFRTAFEAVDGQPVQRPLPPMSVDLPLVDLTGFPAMEQEGRAEQLVADTVRDPFDLGAPPLARWVLIRHDTDDHTLVHVEHHLVHDGWSYALFLRELRELYPAIAAGLPSPLPEPAVRYTDFALWQRNWLRGDVLDAYLKHWTEELAGVPAALDLPTDRPRPVSQSFAGAALRVEVPPALCRRLRAYGRAHATTLYATMLTGFAALMSRYSGQRDVVIGSGVANRRLAEIEQMMGMVVNSVPLRVDLSGRPCFDELVSRVHATAGRAYEWQDVPLDRLVDALALPRDASRNPLFQVMFSFHDSQIPDLEFAGLQGTVTERHNGSAKTDLNIVVIPRAEQLAGHGVDDDDAPITLIWEYATDLFDRSTMRAMVAHYFALLAAALAGPTVDFGRLPLLTDDERRQVVAGSLGPTTVFPSASTIPELFAEQLVARPDAVALVHGGRTHTYAELDRAANRIAHVLLAHGVGRDVPVGVLLERGDDLVTALLAVVKAGGAYVPLDPGYPEERLGWMLADVAAPVVVTRSDLRGLVGQGRVIAVDELTDEFPTPVTPPSPARPDSLAYILFTSGSTGRPKGVLVEHRSVLRLVRDTDYVAFGPDERFAQVADASFDAFTFELWGALLHGGTLCVVDTADLLTAGGLGKALRDNKVTSMFLTSALFTEVMADHPDSFAGLTNLLVGGDALNVDRIRRLLDRDDRPTRLLNGYGPTETTTFAVCHHIEALSHDAMSVPIGRPIANTSGYVLDQYRQPAPVGVPGELYLGGPGVARGYANRPALTADRFLPDPFAADGSRMYRTGDLVRYRADGVLEFLGRADNQVKIRGFRVEPGEVEAALAAHPEVRQAAVLVDDHPSGRRLVAYVVTTAEPDVLRDFLAGTLPPYLLPAAYVPLPALPLTSSGKLDRSALPPVGDEPVADGFTAPRTATEQAVAGLLAELLGVPTVDVTRDFFAMGGNSLLAMRLVARVNERCTAEVPLQRFLQAPTVARLASEVDSTRATTAVAVNADADQGLLDRIDELSDDEVDALLREMAEKEVDR